MCFFWLFIAWQRIRVFGKQHNAFLICNELVTSFRILFSPSDLTFTSFSHSTLATQDVKKLPNKTRVIMFTRKYSKDILSDEVFLKKT